MSRRRAAMSRRPLGVLLGGLAALGFTAAEVRAQTARTPAATITGTTSAPGISTGTGTAIAAGTPTSTGQPATLLRPQTVAPLPGGLDGVLVVNDNNPELITAPGILISTFAGRGRGVPEAHLDVPLNGRFDLFSHHVLSLIHI